MAAGHVCVLAMGDSALERIIKNVETGEGEEQTEEVGKRDCSHLVTRVKSEAMEGN